MESGQSHGSNPRTAFPSSGLIFSIGPKARVLAPRVEKAFDEEKSLVGAANLRDAVELYLEDQPEERSRVISQVTVGGLAVA